MDTTISLCPPSSSRCPSSGTLGGNLAVRKLTDYFTRAVSPVRREYPMSPEDRAVNPPRAMLVDLDDTIIDYRCGVDPCWRLVCADATAQVPGLDPDDLFRQILRTREWYWSDLERHRIGRADLIAASTGIVLQSLRKLGFDLPGLARDVAVPRRGRDPPPLQEPRHSPRHDHQRLQRRSEGKDRALRP